MMIFNFRGRKGRGTAVPLLLFLLLLLTSCGLGSAQKGRKPSPDWSRGIPLDTSIAGTVGMVVSENGEIIHVAWPTVVDDDLVIHYMQLDKNSVPIVDRNLDLPAGRARTPRLLLDNTGALRMVWARRPGGGLWELWQAVLDSEGNVVETSQFVTADMNVSDYAIAQDANDPGFVVWEDAKTDSIWGTSLDNMTDSTLLVESGIAPSIQVDPQGNLHMSWFNKGIIYYAAFADGQLAPTAGQWIVDMEMGPADTLSGPVLAVTDDLGYIVWSRYIATGLESDTGRTDYVAFSLDTLTALGAFERVSIPSTEDPTYELYESNYSLTALAAPPPIVSMASSYTIQPNSARVRGNEVAMTVAT